MTIERKLLGTTPVSGEVLPEAVSFDGTTDYLKRTSDMTGNADGKTWTFSAWVYNTGASQNIYSTYQSRFQVICQGNYFTISAKSTTEDAMFASYPNAPLNTWNHILISCNQASTSQRHIYINGVAHTTFNTYVNGNIDFTETQHYIGAANSNHIYKLKGRLAHVYLDKTYRDLSVTANRRLFIDADGKPADSDTLAALNPIMYMPLTDAATAGSNSGTGGDFTVNGVLATAERGPNQDNCSASTFDGSADYLNKTGGLTNGVDSKQWTISANLRYTSADTSSGVSNRSILYLLGGKMSVSYYADAAGSSAVGNRIEISLNGPSGDVIDTIRTSYGATGYDRNFSLQISGDQTNFNKLKIMLNGEALAVESIVAQYNRPVGFANTGASFLGSAAATSGHIQGAFGEIWVHNTYTDLATDNPFWDSDANRPNSVRKVIADTGVTPLIALPLMGNNAGNNLGSGGDFTVNSGPYTGARGGSEFWARTANFNGSSGYLSRGTLTGASNSKTVTVAYYCNLDVLNIDATVLELTNTGSPNQGLRLSITPQDANQYRLQVSAYDTSVSNILSHQTAYNGFSADKKSFLVLFSFNAATSAFKLFVDGVDYSSSGTPSITNAAIDMTGSQVYIGVRADGHQDVNGDIGFLYLSTDYIDFSQESNRNKFVDQLGYPKDLGADGSEPTGSSPLIYMKFDDTAALGTNSGSGGNFTVNGGVVAGSDFSI
jgi:hypothetical protein